MNRLITIRNHIKQEVFNVRSCLLAFVLVFTFCFNSQAQINVPLACNDKVQISLDENCEAEMNLDIVLEGDRDDYNCLRLVIKDPQGNVVVNYPATGSGLSGLQINQELDYKVIDDCTGNSCWGKLWVEDKIPPPLFCENDTISCANSAFPGDPILGRYEMNTFSSSITGMNSDTLELTFASPTNKDIFDVNLFVDLGGSSSLSNLSAAIRSPSGTTLYAFKNPLKDNDDPNCLDSGIVATFDDNSNNENDLLQSETICKLQTTPSIFGSFHSLDSISNFKDETAMGSWKVLIINDDGTAINPAIAQKVVLELIVAEDYINIPVHQVGAEFTYLGDNIFSVEGLGLCDAVTAEFNDTYLDDCLTLTDGTATIGQIERCWTIHDAAGNSATCCETIYLKQSKMKDIVCPPNYDDNDLPAFDCPSDYAGYELPNGAPHPHVTGYPYDSLSIGKTLCSNMQTGFDDQIIKVKDCGNSFKVVRNWTILDWCNGHIDYCVQIIKVVDDVEPVLLCKEDFVVYMNSNPYKCGADFEVPPPNVISECNDYNWTVEYIPTKVYGECDPPEDSDEYTQENVVVSNGKTIIKDLPLGCSWIRYIVEDECGNISEGKCRVEVKVNDNIPPIPVCDEKTTVAVTINGHAVLHATSLDDGSWDNCMIDSFKVAKMTDSCYVEKDPEYQAGIFLDKVKFCCEEVGQTIMVRLRVWDRAGNSNDCMVEVEVQDKIPPILRCPPDLTLSCQANYKDLDITGEPEYLDNCLVNNPEYSDIEHLDQCGVGHVYRIWTVSDNAGFKTSCTQHLYLREFDPFEMEDRDFPEDIELTECTSMTDPEITGLPNLEDDDKCSLVAATFEDQVFSFVDGACRKIIREWTVIDWCQFEKEDSCVDESLIDLNANCPAIYDPVCGCNGVTYPNACEAENYGGVRYWIPGPCNPECKNPLNLQEILANWGDKQDDSQLREVRFENKFYYVLIDSLNCFNLQDPWTIFSDTIVYDCQGKIVFEYGENEIDAPWYGQPLPEGRIVWDCDEFPIDTYNSKTGTPGLWQRSQIIKVNNYEAPVFDGDCADITLCSYGPGCGGDIILTNSATDDCTPSDQLHWHWKIYTFGAGFPNNPEFVGHNTDASGFYPDGKHRIVWTVEDQCGNVSVCDYYFTVVDCKPPTPYCLSSVTTVVMPINGQVEVWAIDFDRGSSDNCTTKDKLRYSFSDDVNDQYILFNCTDIPNGKSQQISLELWVTDLEGNQDFCQVKLELQDNAGDFCEDVEVASAQISGSVHTEENEPVMNVEVHINSNLPEFPKTELTSDGGIYSFENLPQNYNYEMTASKTDDPSNGVSTLDLVLIQKHILGIKDLTSPYKVIAADADNSGYVSAADLIQIRKLILGVAESFPNGQNEWRFVNEKSIFGDEFNPFPFEETIDIHDLENKLNGVNFMAIKIGDVNSNAKVNQLATTEVRSDETLSFLLKENSVNGLGIVNIPVYGANFNDIIGFQFSLKYDQKMLEYIGFHSGEIELDNSNFGLNRLEDGLLTMSWNATTGRSYSEDQELFILQFEPKSNQIDISGIDINSDRTSAEAYHSDLSVLKTELKVIGQELLPESKKIKLYQNSPNPFTDYTIVGFYLPDADQVTLTIFDVSGKSVKTYNGKYQSGLNELRVLKSDLETTGVLYYTLETGNFNSTMKMIVIE